MDRKYVCVNVLVVCVLHTGGEDVGVNPKISNMLQGYLVAKYDVLWISDSGCLGACTHTHTQIRTHTQRYTHLPPYTLPHTPYPHTSHTPYHTHLPPTHHTHLPHTHPTTHDVLFSVHGLLMLHNSMFCFSSVVIFTVLQMLHLNIN